jgi:hypothetical protein
MHSSLTLAIETTFRFEVARNGGRCTGQKMGNLGDGCVNLGDAFGGRRIKCVALE